MSQRQSWAGSERPERRAKSREIRDCLCLKWGLCRGPDTLRVRGEHTRREEELTPASGSSSEKLGCRGTRMSAAPHARNPSLPSGTFCPPHPWPTNPGPQPGMLMLAFLGVSSKKKHPHTHIVWCPRASEVTPRTLRSHIRAEMFSACSVQAPDQETQMNGRGSDVREPQPTGSVETKTPRSGQGLISCQWEEEHSQWPICTIFI